jgi:nicotinate phosphoribosyltransferase
MVKKMTNKTMLTDLYQLTMMASYLDNGKDETATFDLFIRNLPKDWGYYIATGIEDVIGYVTNIHFTEEDILYLREQNLFNEEFLGFLRDFRFNGDIYAVREGTPFFPNEPVLRVTAPRTQAQFLETALLNIINFQTMIATKANRVVNAADGASVLDFGLRRAQEEDAAMKGARAAYIGGAVATSNVKAGKENGIPISGTMAHSLIMSFRDETDAFRAYARTFPNNCVLLIDTYDTVEGARKAAIVGKEMEAAGKKLKGVRLDSGNLEDLSKKVRAVFDEEKLDYVRIFVSNDLNEYKIEDLVKNNAPIDAYGVGTEMITAKPVAAIPGVYKLVEDEKGPRIKLSAEKTTLPGIKQIYRINDDQGNYVRDIIALEGENVEGMPLLEKIIENGKRFAPVKNLEEIRQYALDCVHRLPAYLKRVKVEQKYDVGLSEDLENTINTLVQEYATNQNKIFA